MDWYLWVEQAGFRLVGLLRHDDVMFYVIARHYAETLGVGGIGWLQTGRPVTSMVMSCFTARPYDWLQIGRPVSS